MCVVVIDVVPRHDPSRLCSRLIKHIPRFFIALLPVGNSRPSFGSKKWNKGQIVKEEGKWQQQKSFEQTQMISAFSLFSLFLLLLVWFSRHNISTGSHKKRQIWGTHARTQTHTGRKPQRFVRYGHALSQPLLAFSTTKKRVNTGEIKRDEKISNTNSNWGGKGSVTKWGGARQASPSSQHGMRGRSTRPWLAAAAEPNQGNGPDSHCIEWGWSVGSHFDYSKAQGGSVLTENKAWDKLAWSWGFLFFYSTDERTRTTVYAFNFLLIITITIFSPRERERENWVGEAVIFLLLSWLPAARQTTCNSPCNDFNDHLLIRASDRFSLCWSLSLFSLPITDFGNMKSKSC